MRAQFVDVKGTRTRVLSSGTGGAAILLAHGFGVSADMWVRLIDRLGAAGFEVLAPDMLGHGFTDWTPVTDRNPEAYLADHLAETMLLLGHRRYFVVGSSLGGVVGTHLLRRHHDAVRGLVMIGTDAPFGDRHSLDPSVLTQAAANAKTAMSSPTWEACERRLRNICVTPDIPLADIALVQTTIYAQADRLAAYEQLCREMIRSIESGSAAVSPDEIDVPTLVVCGHDDIRARIDLIRAHYGRIKGARLVEIASCGHLPHLEAPETLLKALEAFFAEQMVA